MNGFRYHPPIDGLRAIAVCGVLLFHLERDLLRGGFCGVDVFFVISGYLISAIAVREQLTSQFTLGHFYQRRIARILPLAIFVVLAVLVTAAAAYTPQDLSSAGAVAAAATLCIANLKFMWQSNYFEMSTDAQPLLHYWSLSLEEQFYLLWPGLMTFCVKPGGHVARLSRVTTCLTVMSCIACIWMTQSYPTRAFFLLPTRAWELLAGSLLALNQIARSAQGETTANAHRWTRTTVGIFGIGGLIACYVWIQDDARFPGVMAFLPVIATCATIWSCETKSVVTATLSLKPLVAVGLASYSLYLWHWPIFCFIDYAMFAQSGPLRAAYKISLLIPVTVASYCLFEKPTRKLLSTPQRRQLAFAATAIVMSLTAATGLIVRRSNYYDSPARAVASGGIVTRGGSSHRIALVGDSKGAVYAKFLHEWAKKANSTVYLAAVAAGDPRPGSELFESILALLDREKPDAVIVAAAWSGKGFGDDRSMAQEFVRMLSLRCKQVVLVAEPPILGVREYRDSIRRNGMQGIDEVPNVQTRRKTANNTMRGLTRPPNHFIEVDDVFTDRTGHVVLFDEEGRLLFQDQKHISSTGAAIVGDRIIQKIIADVDSLPAKPDRSQPAL